MPKDDWSDLRETFRDMAEEETQRVKLAVVKTFANSVATPVEDGGLAPVDTGNWLANNMLVYGRVNKQSNYDEDPEGISTKMKIYALAEQSKPFNIVAIQNNSEYNDEVEYSGWAKTPAYRPYRTAWEELKAKLKDL